MTATTSPHSTATTDTVTTDTATTDTVTTDVACHGGFATDWDPATTFRHGLATRNRGVVDEATQDRLASATILVAGCGSIGGAAVEPLVRLGATRFILADPGTYELDNLNRQNAVYADLDANKADVAAERILSINPYASVEVHPTGITAAMAADAVSRADVIVDGVDVTTRAGLEAKVTLHEQAAAHRTPLFTGWDMAGTQYVRVYDYRTLDRPFDGRLARADLDRLTMWEVLQRLVPVRFVPLEMVDLMRDNLTNPEFSFPQLVQAADLFGVMASQLVPELLMGRPVRTHTCIDVYQALRPARARWQVAVARPLHLLAGLAALRRTDTVSPDR